MVSAPGLKPRASESSTVTAASSDVKGTPRTFNPIPSAHRNEIVMERRRSGMSAEFGGDWQDSSAASALGDIPLHRLTFGCKIESVSDFTSSESAGRAPHAADSSLVAGVSTRGQHVRRFLIPYNSS
jgi:hypothetical protein